MKMRTTRSLFPYDVAARRSLQAAKLRHSAILHYASLAAVFPSRHPSRRTGNDGGEAWSLWIPPVGTVHVADHAAFVSGRCRRKLPCFLKEYAGPSGVFRKSNARAQDVERIVVAG